MIGIAGAGIGGLTLAVALQRLGVEVVVLERQAQIRDSGAGISLWPNALAALDAIGVGEMVRSLGAASGGAMQLKRDGRPGVRVSGEAFRSALGGEIVCVYRGDLVAQLAACLPAGAVRTGVAVSGYDLAGAAVRVRLADGGQAKVDGLVGADGIYSAVASSLSGPLCFSYSGYTAWRAVARGVGGLGEDSFGGCLAGGHEFGWLPLGGDRTYWFATACLPEGGESQSDDDAYLAEVFGEWPAPVADLVAATATQDRVRNDIVDRGRPRRWTDGPVSLLGDAAHPMRPHLGQGGCQAIEDAAVLASSVARHRDLSEAFRAYERRRRGRTELIVRMSRHSGFTFPLGRRTNAMDAVLSGMPAVSVPAISLRVLAPIAGYQAGRRAVSR